MCSITASVTWPGIALPGVHFPLISFGDLPADNNEHNCLTLSVVIPCRLIKAVLQTVTFCKEVWTEYLYTQLLGGLDDSPGGSRGHRCLTDSLLISDCK